MPFHWTGKPATRHYARVSLLLALLVCWFTGTPGWASTIDKVAVHRDRIVLTFDTSVASAASFMLNGPQRIAVDIDGVAPGGRVDAGGPVAQVRQGWHDGGARVVFDLDRPAIVTAGRFGRDGRQLTLELASAGSSDFARVANGRLTRYRSGVAPARDAVTMTIPAAAKGPPLPRVYGDDTRPLVVIDPGHGGHDPGAISPDTGLEEKDITLKIAKAIRDDLVKSGRVRVALTRSDDRYLQLRERYQIARRLHADLFISIHCDSVGSADASGATAYTLSEVASDKEAALLAARENKADIISGVDLDDTSSDVSSLLIDLAQRETMNASASFAQLLGREAKPLIPTKDQFHRMASLMVLKAADMPSILFETGYISNPDQAHFLNSADGEEKIAKSVRKAVEIHFARQLTRGQQLAAN
ncbi:N-acetylmuramoyl-L-alanine amidase [Hephaestia mangrovi]|uniref:N-acetylmuramoyl-L-alanine amidase n=1 Tax=Hephaestia mangrovi TaxID=2873268 RepID=UPI002106469B|nr:N-acetylmuramoyl-L-alanine amidase [Hephaestia mangrovi]